MSLLKYFKPTQETSSSNDLLENNSVTDNLTVRETEEISNQLQKDEKETSKVQNLEAGGTC